MSLSDEMTQAILRAECTIALMEDDVDRLERQIEAAKQRLESLKGEDVWQSDLHEVIEILEGKQ